MQPDATDTNGGQVEWKYAVNHDGGYDTRHEAIGQAAIINREQDPRRRDVEVWAYPECDCTLAVQTLGPTNTCGKCGATIA